MSEVSKQNKKLIEISVGKMNKEKGRIVTSDELDIKKSENDGGNGEGYFVLYKYKKNYIYKKGINKQLPKEKTKKLFVKIGEKEDGDIVVHKAMYNANGRKKTGVRKNSPYPMVVAQYTSEDYVTRNIIISNEIKGKDLRKVALSNMSEDALNDYDDESKKYILKLGPLHILTDKEKNKLVNFMCNSLQELHSKNIIHGDLKPDNIMVKKNEEGKIIGTEIIDYGYANDYTENRSPFVASTVPFASPENIIRDGAYLKTGTDCFPIDGKKEDIFRLGLSIIELYDKDWMIKISSIASVNETYCYDFLNNIGLFDYYNNVKNVSGIDPLNIFLRDEAFMNEFLDNVDIPIDKKEIIAKMLATQSERPNIEEVKEQFGFIDIDLMQQKEKQELYEKEQKIVEIHANHKFTSNESINDKVAKVLGIEPQNIKSFKPNPNGGGWTMSFTDNNGKEQKITHNNIKHNQVLKKADNNNPSGATISNGRTIQ